MKFASLIALAGAVLAPILPAAEGYSFGPDKSKVAFVINNKPPGADEFTPVPGTFKEFEGSIVFDEESPSDSKVELEVRTASVDTGNKKRDDHLRNPDFFKVKEYPTMSFRSTAVKKLADDKYEVTGDFTLLGETKPVTAVFELSGEHSGTAKFRIKRSDYGMTYRVPDTADEVDVTLTIVAQAKG